MDNFATCCHILNYLSQIRKIVKDLKHRINNSCTWGSKHALVIRGLKLFNFFSV
jgi:hypothetical protein